MDERNNAQRCDGLSPSSHAAAPPLAALDPPQLTTASPVNLHVVAGKAYVWEVEDVKRLRIDHHISGVLSGTLPQVAQQNVFLGLPLQLLPEEVAVLLHHHLAVLVDDVSAHREHPATPEQARSYAQHRQRDAERQQAMTVELEREKEKMMRERYAGQIEAKRKEKAEKKRRQLLARAEDLGEGQQEGLFDAEPEQRVQRDQTPVSTSDNVGTPPASTGPAPPWTVSIAATSTALPWYTPTKSICNLEEARQSGLFSFPDPEDEMQIARFHVYHEVWKRGYFMGKGLKFGGDYLVYPGDPLRFHSHFTLTVLPTPESRIPPLDIVSWGRLATAVKKSCLLGCWDAQKQEARYISLEWAGFG